MKLRFFVIPILVLFTLLQPLRSFLFHQDVGVLSSIEWAMDMDNDTEQEEKKKDQEDLKNKAPQRMHIQFLESKHSAVAVLPGLFISSFTAKIHLPPPEPKA